MYLSTWIAKKGGNAKAGALLGVRRNCAYAWTKGTALPRAHVMKAIVKKTGGRVSYEEMVNEYLEKRTARKAKKKTARTKALTKASTYKDAFEQSKERGRKMKHLIETGRTSVVLKKKQEAIRAAAKAEVKRIMKSESTLLANRKKKKRKEIDPGF